MRTAALLAVVLLSAPLAAQAPVAASATNAVGATPVERVDLLVGRSTVLRTTRPIKRVSLPKPDVADAVVTSSNEVLVHGKTPGVISLFIWADNGDIRTFDVVVRRDLSELEQRVQQLFPGESIQVTSNGGDVVLSGVVSSKYVVDKAVSLAGGYVEKADNVVNLLRQQEGLSSNQVLLRVRFAEVSRTALQELGASFFTSPTGVKNTIGRVTTQQFSAPGYERLEYTKDSDDFGAPVTSAAGQFTFNGAFTGNPMADYMLGRPSALLHYSTIIDDAIAYEFQPFIADDFKVNRNLTLNLGVRYSLDFPWYQRGGRNSTFRMGQESTMFPNAPPGLVVAGDAGIPKGMYPTDRNNFAPRFGLAWDVKVAKAKQPVLHAELRQHLDGPFP